LFNLLSRTRKKSTELEVDRQSPYGTNFYILYFVFYSLFLILVQLTLLCFVVYGSTVSAPCCLAFFIPSVFMLFCLISLHYVNGINEVMMMMMRRSLFCVKY